MSDLKTKQTDAPVEDFLNAIGDEQRREDCRVVLDIMKKATRAEPKMWGKSMIGFGRYHYKYASGREGDWFLVGFSPRKNDLTICILAGLERYEPLLRDFGRHKVGKSCLYIKRLSDIDQKVLRKLIVESLKHMKKTYECGE